MCKVSFSDQVPGGQEVLTHCSVQQVNGGSKAEQADLQPGDVILEINGVNTTDMLNVEAQNKIKNSKTHLQLVVGRYAGMHNWYWINIPAKMTCGFMLWMHTEYGTLDL